MYLLKMKYKTDAVPDELNPELYDALSGNKGMLGGLDCMISRKIDKGSKPTVWKM